MPWDSIAATLVIGAEEDTGVTCAIVDLQAKTVSTNVR
jgi:hypothetical protein